MQLEVRQDFIGIDFKYSVYRDGKMLFWGRANRTIIPYLKKITLMDLNHEEICQLKQTNLAKFVLSKIPVFKILNFSACPYEIYTKSQKIGFLKQLNWIKKQGPDVVGIINNKAISIFEHTGNEFSVFCNEEQVASISRKAFKTGDGDSYLVTYDRVIEDYLIAIIALLLDQLFSTEEGSINGESYSYTYKIGQGKKDSEWMPRN